MASRLNFYQSNSKQNFRVKSAKISYNYINYYNSNQNYNNNISRIQTNLRAQNRKMPIQNNRYNHQIKIINFPYINSYNYFINNLQGKTPKKINIKNDKRIIYTSKKKLLKPESKSTYDLFRKNNTLSSKKYNTWKKIDLENEKKILDIIDFPKQKKKYKLKEKEIYKNIKKIINKFCEENIKEIIEEIKNENKNNNDENKKLIKSDIEIEKEKKNND